MFQKTSYDATFYIKNVLPLVKQDGNRLIGPDFAFQQDGAKPNTSKATIKAIKSMGFSLIMPDIWPSNLPDLNLLDYFFGTQKKYSKKHLIMYTNLLKK